MDIQIDSADAGGDGQLPVIGHFSNSFAKLPPGFSVAQAPAVVGRPELVVFNKALAKELGLEPAGLDAAALASIFSGNTLPAGTEPIAMAYAGHQFGNFVPQLGDGRAILLGEVTDRAGVRRDIQLKGAGRTVFSRGGDGRAALGPVLREYLLSEAMHALGIPATRALAAVTTGEVVWREQALPGAVLTRVLASNIRTGTFQYFAARGDAERVKILADYVIARHYPEAGQAENPYLALLEAVLARQAALVARWLHVGFIHGVMNTDNMAVSGETIDFGPCAFMDAYDPATVFSSIDQSSRYAYANQPRIAQWNVTRFAETLLGLINADEGRAIELATGVISGFGAKFDAVWLDGMRAKIGLRKAEAEDRVLIQSLLDLMQSNAVDYSLLFRRLGEDAGLARRLFKDTAGFDDWTAAWRIRFLRETADQAARAVAMGQVNPVFIPRNHLVEAALGAAVERNDFGPFHELSEVLRHPYVEQPAFSHYAEAPPPSDVPFRTYCGT